MTKLNIQRILARWYYRLGLFLLLSVGLFLILSGLHYFLIPLDTSYDFKFFIPLISVLLPTLYIASHRNSSSWYMVGLKIDSYSIRDLIYGFMVALSALLIFVGVFLLSGFEFHFDLDEFNSVDFIYISLLIFAGAATEEIIFRGVIFQAILEKFSAPVTIMTLAFIFSFMHASNPGFTRLAFLNIFLAGVLLGVMYFQTRSLWAPISFHFFWNFFQFSALGMPVSGHNFGNLLIYFTKNETGSFTDVALGGDFGIEGGFITTIFLLFATYYSLIKLKQSPYISSQLFKRRYYEASLNAETLPVFTELLSNKSESNA